MVVGLERGLSGAAGRGTSAGEIVLAVCTGEEDSPEPALRLERKRGCWLQRVLFDIHLSLSGSSGSSMDQYGKKGNRTYYRT